MLLSLSLSSYVFPSLPPSICFGFWFPKVMFLKTSYISLVLHVWLSALAKAGSLWEQNSSQTQPSLWCHPHGRLFPNTATNTKTPKVHWSDFAKATSLENKVLDSELWVSEFKICALLITVSFLEIKNASTSARHGYSIRLIIFLFSKSPTVPTTCQLWTEFWDTIVSKNWPRTTFRELAWAVGENDMDKIIT